MLVDGYNIIFAWKELKETAGNISLEAARDKLLSIMSNYQGLKRINIIVVFDAHHVKAGTEKVEKYNNIDVVYTKESESADNYIERAAGRLSRYNKVSVATSDNLEQIIIIGKGAQRLSATALLSLVEEANADMRKTYIENKPIKSNMLYDHLDDKTAALLEKMRRNEMR